MVHTLLNKYLAGETTANEERELKRLLLGAPPSQLSEEERAIRDLLSYTEAEADEEDIFAIDLSEEYDKVVRPKRSIRIWPYVAAACVAGALFLFLTPPKDEAGQHEFELPIAVVLPDTTATELLADEAPEPPQQPASTEETSNEKPAAPRQLMAEVILPTSAEEEEGMEQQDIPTAVPSQPDENMQLAALQGVGEEPAETYTITHPERLEYTPEELEVLKERARQKYMEWIQLEQEILEADKRRTANIK